MGLEQSRRANRGNPQKISDYQTCHYRTWLGCEVKDFKLVAVGMVSVTVMVAGLQSCNHQTWTQIMLLLESYGVGCMGMAISCNEMTRL